MEQLKKRLKTDEDLAWVDHSKTLDEQEIHEQDVVLLRRRFFYSDQNIDTRDPIQLGLLYVQTRDAILSGTHPVTLDGACRFAGLQCQAQLGDFVEGKTTRPGYINLKDYLPLDYSKQKHIERKVFIEHKRYYGLSELEAKAKYVSEARSLPTYGVTFFLVKEKLPGKNKLVPRLLGITKDCVMRVDADSKGILKTWPLTTVKRWAASMNSFTLDFGDYSDSYYSVQTSEGEQISQLIAGYIDIILKRRKAKDHFGIEGDEGATMIEDSVAPSRATIIQNKPAALTRPPSAAPSLVELNSSVGPTVERVKLEEGPLVEPAEFRPALEVRGRAEIGYETRPATKYVTNYELSLPQRDLQDRLEQAQEAVEEAQKVLDRGEHSADRSRLGPSELEQRKRKLSGQFAEINAATAQLVSLSAIPEEELNYPALNTAVETVAGSLPGLAKDVRVVASLMEDEEGGERLIEAARRLCKAFSDLLNAAEPGPTVPRQSLISAASRVGDATQALLYTINDGDEQEEEEREKADVLLSLTKSVANLAAALVLKSKDVASTCQDKRLEESVIGSATQCALATSQMVASAKIVAPTIHDPSCQRQLLEACREVQRAVDGIQGACEQAIRDEGVICGINDTANRVNRALDDLMEHVRNMKRRQASRTSNSNANLNTSLNANTNTHTSTTSTTTTVHKILDESSGRPLLADGPDPAKSELVKQARTLARATAKLIQDIRPEGGEARLQQQQQQQQQVEAEGEHERHSRQQSVYDGERLSPSSSARQEAYEEERAYRQQVQQRQQQQQQQQQQSSTTTTTITTTVYDQEQRQERPVSMYESDSSWLGQERRTADRAEEFEEQRRRERIVSSSREEYVEQAEQRQQQQLEQEGHQQPAAGEQPEAAISGIVGDLETTILFATAGTLRAQDEHDSYLYHRENVLRCAKALVADTRPLVASAASDQQQLAQAAHESVYTMSNLADTVKASAASLGPNNVESQVNLIRSVKEVAVSLSDLIGSTKSALGCDTNDPRLIQVKDSAKTMVSSVTSLLKTVKSVEEEQQRGVRAIEAAIEAIEQELASYASKCANEDPKRKPRCSAEELARASRPVTMATAKTVHAASSGLQDDAIVAANMGRKALIDLLSASSSASFGADSYELRIRVQEAGRSCALNYKHLIELLHRIFQHPSIASANPEIKQELIAQSKSIASCVSELVSCSELLRGGQSWQEGGGDDEPTLVAESELLGAASSIDAAARKLENLKPRVSSVKVS